MTNDDYYRDDMDETPDPRIMEALIAALDDLEQYALHGQADESTNRGFAMATWVAAHRDDALAEDAWRRVWFALLQVSTQAFLARDPFNSGPDPRENPPDWIHGWAATRRAQLEEQLVLARALQDGVEEMKKDE